MAIMIVRSAKCPKCGQNQWLVPDEYLEKPNLPEVPISGRNVKRVKAKIKKICEEHKKSRQEMRKRSVCMTCYSGAIKLVKGIDAE